MFHFLIHQRQFLIRLLQLLLTRQLHEEYVRRDEEPTRCEEAPDRCDEFNEPFSHLSRVLSHDCCLLGRLSRDALILSFQAFENLIDRLFRLLRRSSLPFYLYIFISQVELWTRSLAFFCIISRISSLSPSPSESWTLPP
jgi:hypothetical protein